MSLYVRHCACALYSHERFCLNKENQSNDGSQQDRCALWRPGEHGWERHCRCSVGGSSAVMAVIALRSHRAVNTRGMCARYTSLRTFPLQRRLLRVGNSPVEFPEKWKPLKRCHSPKSCALFFFSNFPLIVDLTAMSWQSLPNSFL